MNKLESRSHYDFDSFKIYPRVHYFQTRFSDVFQRFEKVEGALPKCFQNAELLEELRNIKIKFENGLHVEVYGDQDLKPDQFIKTQPVKDVKSEITVIPRVPEKPKEPELTIHIYSKISNFEDAEELQGAIEEVIELSEDEIRAEKFIVITCKTGINIDDDKIESCGDVSNTGEPGFVAMGFDELKDNISYRLECVIMRGLDKMLTYLDQFKPLASQYFLESEEDILKSESIAVAIRQFLRSDYTFHDIYGRSTRTSKERCRSSVLEKENSVAVDVNAGLEALARVIKCTSVTIFAKKYRLSNDMCNALLCQVEFEKGLLKRISKNTRYHFENRFKKAVNHLSDTGSNYKFDFVVYILQDNLKQVFQEVEEKVSSFQKLTVITQRMNLEILGYMKQTFVDEIKAKACENMPVPSIDTSLRQELLDINGVYGLGTFFGQLEIHIDKDTFIGDRDKMIEDVINKQSGTNIDGTAEGTSEQTENEKDNTLKKETKNTRNEKDENQLKEEYLCNFKHKISSSLIKHKYFLPYSVRFVVSKPTQFMNVNPGARLKCRDYMHINGQNAVAEYLTGTLGCYLKVENGVVALTCAHVIGPGKEVFIDGRKTTFSTWNKKCPTGASKLPLLDIAALKVHPSHEQMCKTCLDDVRHVVEVEVSKQSPCDLIGRRVHKFGASTEYTEGVILSVDYRRNKKFLGMEGEKYLFLVDSKANIPESFTVDFDSIPDSNVRSNQLRSERDSAVPTNEGPTITDVRLSDPILPNYIVNKTKNKTVVPGRNDSEHNPAYKKEVLETENTCEASRNMKLDKQEKTENKCEASRNMKVDTQENTSNKFEASWNIKVNKQDELQTEYLYVREDRTETTKHNIEKYRQPIIANNSKKDFENTKVKRAIAGNPDMKINQIPNKVISKTKENEKFQKHQQEHERDIPSLEVSGVHDESITPSRSKTEIDESATKLKCKRSTPKFPKLLTERVYVRDNNGHLDDKQVFGEKGDSGAIICVDNLDLLNYSALSMLLAGDFQVEGYYGRMCLSFKLHSGLEALNNEE